MTQPTGTARATQTAADGASGRWEPGTAQRQRAVQKDDDALNVRARIEEVTRKQGFDSIDKNDLRGRMRWMGLYHPARSRATTAPGPATRTPTSSGQVLHDAGALRRRRAHGAAGLRTIGEISTEFARDTADISDRENVQYHWIRIEDVPRSGAAGLRRTADHRGMR